MSQRIITECDECLALGETSDAATVAVRALSIEVEVDLCNRHVKPFVEMLERFAELGRTPAQAAGSGTPCPRCGRRFATPQALGRHTKAAHGATVADMRKAGAIPAPADVKGGFPCPECAREFGSTQGLAVHRSRTHGVKGSSQASESRARHAGEVPEGG